MTPDERTKSNPQNPWEWTLKEEIERSLDIWSGHDETDHTVVHNACSSAIERLTEVVTELLIRIEELEQA